MSKFIMYISHPLTQRDKTSILMELHRGSMVCVFPTCINPHKAEMIRIQSERYLNSLGCTLVMETATGEKFYSKSEIS